MSIVICEVMIKAVVQQQTGGTAKPGGSGSNNSVSANEELLQTAIEKLLDILKDKHER